MISGLTVALTVMTALERIYSSFIVAADKFLAWPPEMAVLILF